MIDNRILMACIAMLVLALPLPYAYMLLRVAIFGVCAYLAVAAFSNEKAELVDAGC